MTIAAESAHGAVMARPRSPLLTLPEHVHRVKARGRHYYYLHIGRGTAKAKERVRLPDPREPEFWTEYRRLVGDGEAGKPAIGTFARLLQDYREAPEWIALSEKTRIEWQRYHARVEAAWGPLNVRELEPRHVLALRDKYATTPAAANNLLRSLSSLLSWSVPRGWRSDNPCEHVPKLKGGDPYEPWPAEAIDRLRAEAPADLWRAAAVALYTGQRQGDCLKMRWSDVKDGRVSVVQEKTGRALWIPVHRDLEPVLAAAPRQAVTVLTTSRGTPWTKDGFKASWQTMMHRLATPGRLVFHGLRKNAVNALLEAGCTPAEVSSITGQSLRMIEHYAKEVNRKKLATAAILKWENASETEFVKQAD